MEAKKKVIRFKITRGVARSNESFEGRPVLYVLPSEQVLARDVQVLTRDTCCAVI
jgi:hypothetical protein